MKTNLAVVPLFGGLAIVDLNSNTMAHRVPPGIGPAYKPL